MAYKSVLHRLKDKEPTGRYEFSAIATLHTPAAMRRFWREYVGYVREEAARQNLPDPDRIASENMGWALGYCGKEAHDAWVRAVPEINHPDFGRRLYEMLETAPEMIHAAGREDGYADGLDRCAMDLSDHMIAAEMRHEARKRLQKHLN